MLHTTPGRDIVAGVHILLATDADWIVDDVTAALGGPDTSFTVCRDGRAVADVVSDRVPDLVILDFQIGSMGGMAVTMALRLDESGGAIPHVDVLMLLDRQADVFMAQRSGADGWLIKPLDSLRLQLAVRAVGNGERFQEGVPVVAVPPVDGDQIDGGTTGEVDESAEEPAPTAG